MQRACVGAQIYVDTDDDVRLARRIQRDVKERGRDVAGVIEQYTRVSHAAVHACGCGTVNSSSARHH